MTVQSPSKLLVEKYLIEIAKNYNVEYEADPQIMSESQDALLIDIENGGQMPNNLDQASGGGLPQPAGFIGFPNFPMPSSTSFNGPGSNNVQPMGFVPPAASSNNVATFNPVSFSYNIPLDKPVINPSVSDDKYFLHFN